MRKLIVEQAFFDLFPQARICGLVAEGLDNRSPIPEEALLDQACREAAFRVGAVAFGESPFFKPWRAAYKAFRAPKGTRSSVEALARRAVKGKGMPSINPLVDLYNVTSLKFLFPCGAEDLDMVAGDVRLTRAMGGEPFLPLGSEEEDPPREGEVVYLDEAGAICRCWNWREADRTKLTAETVRALLCMESLVPERDGELRQALDFVAEHVREHLGASVRVFWLDQECREVGLPEGQWRVL